MHALARGSGAPGANRDTSGASRWSYAGENGPAHWGDLSPEFSTCKNGQMQSPIDIRGSRFAPLPGLSFQYRSSPLEIVNDGHTIRVIYDSGSYLRVGPKRYELIEFHFHTPGEHTINGWRADMVIHLVHQDARGNLAVVAVPVKAGRRHNAMMERLWEYLPRRPGESHYYSHVGIKPIFLLPSKRSYYTYTGSLTFPPCSEGVRWFVLKTPLEISAQQIRRFQQIMGQNARPLQALNARMIAGNR